MTQRHRLTAEERAKIFKALSDPKRVEIVDRLARDGSMCGTELAESMGVSIALVCHHWEVLVDAGILKKERQGQLRVCTLDTDRIRAAASDWSGGGGEAGRAPAKLGLPVKAAKRPKPAKARAKPSKR